MTPTPVGVAWSGVMPEAWLRDQAFVWAMQGRSYPAATLSVRVDFC